MLVTRGMISRELITLLSTWRHSGFHVFCGNRIQPKEETAMENLARYIIRASFSQERMQYLDNKGIVIYSAKDNKERKIFDALEWLAAMCSHVPNREEQMVRYYSYYSNVSRGKRQKETEEDAIPHIMESNTSPTACRKSLAGLTQKIHWGRSAHPSQMAGNHSDHRFSGTCPLHPQRKMVITAHAPVPALFERSGGAIHISGTDSWDRITTTKDSSTG